MGPEGPPWNGHAVARFQVQSIRESSGSGTAASVASSYRIDAGGIRTLGSLARFKYSPHKAPMPTASPSAPGLRRPEPGPRQLSGDLLLRHPGGPQLEDSGSRCGGRLRRVAPLALFGERISDPLAHDPNLPLSDRREHVRDQLAIRRAEVEAKVERDDVEAAPARQLEQLARVHDGPAQPVEPSHDEDVAAPQCCPKKRTVSQTRVFAAAGPSVSGFRRFLYPVQR